MRIGGGGDRKCFRLRSTRTSAQAEDLKRADIERSVGLLLLPIFYKYACGFGAISALLLHII